MLGDIRKLLDRVAARAGLGCEELRTKAFRHTYSDVVEYRVEQHLERLGDRLQRLGLAGLSDTGKDTAVSASLSSEPPRDSATVSGADVSDEWAWVELNYRPHAYQACALTT